MFVIVHNNYVILGPMRWNRFRFENVIEEECEVSYSLPDRNDDLSPILISDDLKILPIQGTENPEFNPKIQFLNGPFWEFTDEVAISSYRVEDLPVDAVKNMLKEQVSAERWTKENAGVTVTINNTEYKFASDKTTRSTIQQLLLTPSDTNWKFDREVWVTFTNAELHAVLTSILDHVQECFNWEFDKFAEIDNCSTLAELDAVIIREEQENNLPGVI